MTQEELDKQGLFKGKSIRVCKKSIGVMLESLLPTENVIIAINCNIGSTNTPGVLTLTDKRLIFTSKVLFTVVRHDFPLKNITSLSLGSAFSNKLIIDSFSLSMTITAIDRKVAQDIINQFHSLTL
ncbi:hypothetical protein D0T49_00215 [Paludibacter sp. 221]|uniref:PH domain-containing protein n=1 Tax=Paludibacter sp. 221 TaxID=2302939 RepID=UPI0013D3F046|nr:PH domain-containing protein [Paludibacter sp. 221]NDV45476.1 hypothetical protein [Paludibacter sp. 221]